MSSGSWRKRFSIWQNRLYLYPAPEPMPHTSLYWFGIGLVTVAVLLFCTYFISYLTSIHTAFLSNAEDMGILDQAIWNTTHGEMLRQTICNTLHDTNCAGLDGITRFAIHFEPILFPISLLYLLWPDPRTLIVFQTIVVALGAYPAFWLARLRLRNEMAAVAIALLYLLYPAQQQATVFDFHAVTLTASLLLFTLYFLYTRRTAWLFVFALLSMACKEEVPILIFCLGLWSVLFQRRWRSGLALMAIALVWLGMALGVIIPHFSPTGKHLLAGRYGKLGNGPLQILGNIVFHPVQIVQDYLLDRSRLSYIRSLLSPAGYLPLLAPWVLILALPGIAINILSSNEQQYTGIFQYNAEIVPILIFATIEALVLLLWLVQFAFARLQTTVQSQTSSLARVIRNAQTQRVASFSILTMLLIFLIFSSFYVNYSFYGRMPYAQNFSWPQRTAHAALAEQIIEKIPADASVSAQSKLVPHISHRKHIYLFPYARDRADYVFLDVTGDVYPYFSSPPYIRDVKALLLSGVYSVVVAQDGYLLLKRGGVPPQVASTSPVQPGQDARSNQLLAFDLPASFCSNIAATQQEIVHPLSATFTGAGGSIELVGFDSSVDKTLNRTGYIEVTTYWRVLKPLTQPLQVLLLLSTDDQEYYASTDVPAVLWCQSPTWKPGSLLQLKSRIFQLKDKRIPNGLVQLSVALLPLVQSSGKIMDNQARLPVQKIDAPAVTQSRNAVHVQPIVITP